MSLLPDRLITGGTLLLILFTPLAFGTVHPWAFSCMEGVIFLLVAVWMGKLLFSRAFLLSRPFPRPLFLPLALFAGLILFQLLPLPPSLLRLLSPATYELYTVTLPGWPEQLPPAGLPVERTDAEAGSREALSSWVVLPTLEEVRRGATVPLAGGEGREAKGEESALTSLSVTRPSSLVTHLSRWRPLSVAPSQTRTDLLKFCAYAALFSLLLLYPFGHAQPHIPSLSANSGEAEQRFSRAVVGTVLCTGLLVAVIGLVQQVTWNGKLLWFFVPYDWGGPRPGGVRHATGPFVLYNHFANYLALIFPLALAGVFAPRSFARREKGAAYRIFCGLTAFLLLVGILLSLSRGGWVGTVLGVGLLLCGLRSLPEEQRPAFLRRSGGSVVRYAVAGLALCVFLSLFFVGPSGRSRVDTRLEYTVAEDAGFWGRWQVWQDSLAMIQDFPLFGVGLGAWPDLFPRYRRPPWSPNFYREAHNDYVELIAETGLLGFGLLAWFFWQASRRLSRGPLTVPAGTAPLLVALLAALGVMAFHESFDFNLQIPANALLFTLFLALALRFSESEVRGQPSEVRSSTPDGKRFALAGGVGGVAIVLCMVALRQERLPYPYYLREPASLAEARQRQLAHPARAASHLSLVHHLLQTNAAPAELSKALEIALWLDPNNPRARDLYAASLVRQGRTEEGLKELTRSVSLSPALSTHFLLKPRLIPWLSADERQAVEAGLRTAVAAGYEGAVNGLGTFYAVAGRFADQARLYEEAARQTGEKALRADYLLKGGLAYTRAGNGEKAEALFRQAIVAAPGDPRAYQYLATRVFAAEGKLDQARTAITEGIRQGADPVALSLALAEAAQRASNNEAVKTALLQALTFQPSSFEAHFRLGQMYLRERNFDRAALSLRDAVNLDPHSALAFYYLGMAEEGRYQLLAAEKAYARAVELAPDNVRFQQRYGTLLKRTTENGTR